MPTVNDPTDEKQLQISLKLEIFTSQHIIFLDITLTSFFYNFHALHYFLMI